MALSDYQTLVTALVRDNSSKIADADRDSAIAQAVQRYSDDMPVEAVEDVTAGADSLLPLPAGWQAGFSELKKAEHPIGERPPSYIPAEEIQDYRTPTTSYHLVLSGITAGEAVRETYTQRHQLDATHDTIPLQHREAVASYAAGICLDQLSNDKAGTTDKSFQAIDTDQRSASQDYAARARVMRAKYFSILGIPADKQLKAAGVVVELESRRGLTHESV